MEESFGRSVSLYQWTMHGLCSEIPIESTLIFPGGKREERFNTVSGLWELPTLEDRSGIDLVEVLNWEKYLLTGEKLSATSEEDLAKVEPRFERYGTFRDWIGRLFRLSLPRLKGTPCRVWSSEETDAMLKLMNKAPRKARARIWDYVSENLFDLYDFDRASSSCKGRWLTLLQLHKKILQHESKTPPVSFWDMNGDERSEKKLPRTFNFEWCKMIEKIAWVCVDTGAESDDEGLGGDSTSATSQADSHVSQCDEVAESDPGRKRSAFDADPNRGADLLLRIISLVNQRAEDAESDPGRKRSAFDADLNRGADLLSRIASLVNQRAEDALQPRLAALIEENAAVMRTLRHKIQKLQ
jgi:hypothetical protein